MRARDLTDDDVRHVATLARLHLTDDQVPRMADELRRIVHYFRQLQEVDTEGVSPTAHVQLERSALRDDAPGEGVAAETALAEAPRTAAGGFAVPGFVED